MNQRIVIRLAFALVFLCCMAVFAVSAWFYVEIKKPMPIGKNPVVFEVKASETAKHFAQRLLKQGYINSIYPLLFYIRYHHYATQLKTGFYQIFPHETAVHLLHRVIKGDVYQLDFRIPEGATYKDIALRLKEAPYLSYDHTAWQTIMGSYQSPEGLLLADTYRYVAGAQCQLVLRDANQSLWTFLNEAYAHRELNLPFASAYDLLIAASIVEKESGVAFERRIIAGVIVNRLNKKMPLQMDPTVIYGLGEAYRGKLSHKEMQTDTPYNTYTRRGLPPTPIAMVSREAILAVAHPLKTDYLYFVAKGDGTHEFSKTYDEQRRAIKKYMKSKGAKP